MSPAQIRKTKGFVNFDMQLFRPDIKKANCHEKRLEAYNYFPRNLSSNKPVPMVDFKKTLSRDDIMYRGIYCSDTLFDMKQLNTVRRGQQGILQFAKIGEKRGD